MFRPIYYFIFLIKTNVEKFYHAVYYPLMVCTFNVRPMLKIGTLVKLCLAGTVSPCNPSVITNDNLLRKRPGTEQDKSTAADSASILGPLGGKQYGIANLKIFHFLFALNERKTKVPYHNLSVRVPLGISEMKIGKHSSSVLFLHGTVIKEHRTCIDWRFGKRTY